jgi:hypothetical protein
MAIKTKTLLKAATLAGSATLVGCAHHHVEAARSASPRPEPASASQPAPERPDPATIVLAAMHRDPPAEAARGAAPPAQDAQFVEEGAILACSLSNSKSPMFDAECVATAAAGAARPLDRSARRPGARRIERAGLESCRADQQKAPNAYRKDCVLGLVGRDRS